LTSEIRVELASLDSAARIHQKTAQALRRKEAAAKTQAMLLFRHEHPLPEDLLQRLDDARERAALMLVREAQRAEARGANDASVDSNYEQAGRLFPDTAAGRGALRRVNGT
jgi:hypothetical protein